MYNLVIIRLLRVFKFFKLSYGLQVLLHTLKASSYELTLLLLILLIPLVVFSSLVYAFEYTGTSGQTDFDSIPRTFWWTIVTMTTVGYGDMAPKTWIGQVIGSLCAIISVLIIALPISVIGNNFNLYYAHVRARLKLPKKNRHLLQGRLRGLLRQPAMLSSRDRDRKNITRRNGNSLHLSSPNSMHGGGNLSVMHAQTAPVHNLISYSRRRDRSGAFNHSQMSIGSTASTNSLPTTQQETAGNNLKMVNNNGNTPLTGGATRRINRYTPKPRSKDIINSTVDKMSTVSIPSEMFDETNHKNSTTTTKSDSNNFNSNINCGDVDASTYDHNTLSEQQHPAHQGQYEKNLSENNYSNDAIIRIDSNELSKLDDCDTTTTKGNHDVTTFDIANSDAIKQDEDGNDNTEVVIANDVQISRPAFGVRIDGSQQRQRQRKKTVNLTNLTKSTTPRMRNPCSVFIEDDEEESVGIKELMRRTESENVNVHCCLQSDICNNNDIDGDSTDEDDVDENNKVINIKSLQSTNTDSCNFNRERGQPDTTTPNVAVKELEQSINHQRNIETDENTLLMTSLQNGGLEEEIEKNYLCYAELNFSQKKHNSSRDNRNRSSRLQQPLCACREENESESDNEDNKEVEYCDSSASSESLVLPSVSLSQKELKDHFETHNKFNNNNNNNNITKDSNGSSRKTEPMPFLTTDFSSSTEESTLRRQSMKKMTTVDFDDEQSRVRALSCNERQPQPVVSTLSPSPFKEIFRKISSPPSFFGYSSKNNVIQNGGETRLNNNDRRSLRRSVTEHNFYRSTSADATSSNNILQKQSLSISDIKSLRESGV